MKKIRAVIVTSTALPIALIAASGSVWAGSNTPLSPQEGVTTRPSSPTVNVSDDKEGASATATDRLDVHKSIYPTATSKTPRTVSTRSPEGSTDSSGAKEDPGRDSTDLTDLKINVGLCGRMQPDGTVPGPTRCQPGGDDRRVTARTMPPEVVRPRPEDVTWELIRSETKNVIFPGLSVKVQPNGRTLVNLDTIVYTDESKVSTTTVTLLGFPVVIEATPISYTWSFGDGSPALTTSTPGKAYPSKEITHKYMKRADVSLTLTTNYAARFNVADTGWHYIDGTVPITGPATPILVREAVPVLVDPGR
ncbi:hypothetical protein [Kribbella pratensis]|uniref:PKD domain-containing protein n=1 Tax=Kribbella pratensis TaxID=2512112 RepID=A0A4R8C3Q2_9ACTN|nr:hypothetical protein [Kribbella pratensis]TDW70449.1 hypothetical protein EV653_4492 [Kribbella pratensis]